MTKKINIIGAGLSGLSAGIYLQKMGVQTEIFEMAKWSGGMFSSWVRKGYRFDGCIHWMVGTKKGTNFNQLYYEVGLLTDDVEIYNPHYLRFQIHSVFYDIPLDITEFQKFLTNLSSEDQPQIDKLCYDIKRMMNVDFPDQFPKSFFKLIPFMMKNRTMIQLMKKYVGITIEEYATRFKNETIRSIIYELLPPHFSAVTLILMLGMRMAGNGGYPIGGSLQAIKRMEQQYLSLGGKINFQSKVDEIVIKNDEAVAIKSNDKVYNADGIIAANDVYDTLKNLLNNNYKHLQLEQLLDDESLFEPIIIVSFGLNHKFSIPYTLSLECRIQTTPHTTTDNIFIHTFDFDPSAAPENCSSVMVTLNAPYQYWNELRKTNIKAYNLEKEQLANHIALEIEKYYPGFKEAIEVIDVATPASYIRLANLYKASYEGFEPTPKMLKTRIKNTIPGIKNLYLCGQWTTAGGGISSAIQSGKMVANKILEQTK